MGEPGIGKTRLLEELAARADARGHLVLDGSASELERDLPFWVFVDALDEYVQSLPPPRLEALDDDVRGELAHVFPSLARFEAAGGPVLQHERYRTHRAVRELLERLTSTMPLVLVLDDLHWADSGSVELLGTLLRRPPAAAVLVALAVRPRQAPQRLTAALERAQRVGILVRIEVGALTRGEAGNSSVKRSTRPLQPLSSMRAAATRSICSSSRGRSLVSAPPAVPTSRPRISTCHRRSPSRWPRSSLSCRTRRAWCWRAAAVAGDPFEPELAAAAAAISEASALEALDELLNLDLVRQTDVPRRFRFRHPLVRRAVYQLTPGGWRLGAHERSAEALASRGAPATERAHHVERSARQGDAAAVATLREAGEAVALRVPASAATWFGEALRLLPSTAPAECESNCSSPARGRSPRPGQFADGHAALLESIGLVPTEAVALRVRLTTACAGVEHLLGRHEEAHACLAGADGRAHRPGITRGSHAHGRARHGRVLPHGLRADA